MDVLRRRAKPRPPGPQAGHGDVSQLQPNRDKHPSPPKIDTEQETWQKDILNGQRVQLSALLQPLTDSL